MPYPTAFPSRKEEISFLIAECRRSREIHIACIELIESGYANKKVISYIGDLHHHRYHVRKYDAVIRLLKEIKL